MVTSISLLLLIAVISVYKAYLKSTLIEEITNKTLEISRLSPDSKILLKNLKTYSKNSPNWQLITYGAEKDSEGVFAYSHPKTIELYKKNIIHQVTVKNKLGWKNITYTITTKRNEATFLAIYIILFIFTFLGLKKLNKRMI